MCPQRIDTDHSRDPRAAARDRKIVDDDLAALTRMHALSGRAVESASIEPLLQETMDAAVAILAADKGTLQLFDGGTLVIAAHCGHERPFLDFFSAAENVASVCGEATRHGERVLVRDVEASDLFAGTSSLPVLRAAGVRAVQSTPLRTRDGRLLGILTTQWSAPHTPDEHDLLRLDLLARQAADLVEQKQATAALRESESRFRQLAESLPLLVWTCRPDGSCDYLGPQWVAYTGIPEAPQLGNGWLEQLHPDDRDRVLAAWSAAAPIAAFFDCEFRIRRHDGVHRWFRTRAVPLRDESGRIVKWFGTNSDIDDAKTAEETQRRLLAKLEATNRAKDEFLATMSHELRTPLNAIVGWATIIGSDPQDGSMRQKGVEVILRNARAQERLIADLLDVSRIISGKLKLSLRRTSLSSVVHAAADAVRPAAESKGVDLVIDAAPDVGELVADPDRLQQVFWNLLANGVRFTPAGGRIALTVDREGSTARVRVEDTGAGIPAEHLPYIFDRFRQVDSSTTRSHGGLGLGLAIVRHLVEAHGGSVEARSDGAGRGATFTVSIPIRVVHAPVATGGEREAEREPSAIATPAGREGATLANVRALVVEDDRDSAQLLHVILTDAGAVVTTTFSAREALEARGPFDVIVCDIGMPEMDGYALIGRIRARESGAEVPALALTAYARSEDAERAIRAGFQEHFAKPVDPAKLVEAIRRHALINGSPASSTRSW